MKNSFTTSILVALTLSSCQEDNSLFNEPMPIRAYETDAQIMAQFVEVDKTSGNYVLNPNKKVTVTDHVVNRSREELNEVSQINRDRFINEMENVNSQLSAMRRSGIVSAFIFSTQYSNTVIDGDDEDSFLISKLSEDPYARGNVATVTLENGRGVSASFHSGNEMVMNVNAPSRSTFYLVQVTLGDQTDEDAETIIISGVKSMLPNHSYRIATSALLDGLKKISGINLIGDGNATISILQ